MVNDSDKLVVAILAATKAAAEKKDKPGEYVAEYERMLRVFTRRVQAPPTDATTPSASPHAS